MFNFEPTFRHNLLQITIRNIVHRKTLHRITDLGWRLPLKPIIAFWYSPEVGLVIRPVCSLVKIDQGFS
jgi:hypothetical protein